MDAEHRRIILRNICKLLERTDMEALVPKLLEKKIFLKNMVSKYEQKNCGGVPEMNLKRDLYLDILTRGPTAFKNLISALYESGHPDLAMLLEPEGKLVPNPPIPRSTQPLPCSEHLQHSQTLSNVRKFADSNPEGVNFRVEPSKILVKKSTKLMESSFTYKTSIYSMESKPKGYAMIINIKKYDDDVKKERVGAENDERSLQTLFQQLGYIVILHKNLTRDKLLIEIESFANDKRHSSVDSCILAVLSHGEQIGRESCLIAADGFPIPVSSVLEYFSNEKCEILRKKPKIFLFQCCRGDRQVHGIKPNFRTKTDGVPRVKLGSYSDMLIAYSTVDGFESHRDIYVGTWFIQTLCEVFMDHACDTEIMEMLKLVDVKLENIVSENNTMQTTCFENRGFKTFFFNPGIYDDVITEKHDLGVLAS